MAKYTETMATINDVLVPFPVQRTHTITFYKTFMALPILWCGNGAWTIRKQDMTVIIACEMKFMQITAGYNKWSHRRYEEFLRKVVPVHFLIEHHAMKAYWGVEL